MSNNWIDVSEAGSNYEMQVGASSLVDRFRHREKRFDGGVFPWKPGKPDCSFLKYPPWGGIHVSIKWQLMEMLNE